MSECKSNLFSKIAQLLYRNFYANFEALLPRTLPSQRNCKFKAVRWFMQKLFSKRERLFDHLFLINSHVQTSPNRIKFPGLDFFYPT